MKFSFFPKTKLGRWSLIFIFIAILLFLFFLIMVNIFDQRGGDEFFSNLTLAIPMTLAGAASLGALVVGLIAIIKSKSRSILVFIATLIGLLVTLFGVLEVTIPH